MAVPSRADAAVGAMLGAFVGDAAGAVLEFAGVPSQATVEEAMRMPGGGVLGVGRGQVTDDSEMALCLAQGLLTGSPPSLPLEAICGKYVEWSDSPPFDIGITTRNAVCAGALSVGPSVAQSMIAAARSLNAESKANGGLMRITPLAVWGHALPDATLAACAAEETSVTHSNPSCQDCSAAYCIAIAHLIRHPGDSKAALAAASSWLQASRPGSEALTWLQEGAVDSNPIQNTAGVSRRTIGFVRWAYTLAFHHLHLRSSYSDAITRTLLVGGDTDTNAAIVGGMIGALHGASSIPQAMKGPVLARSDVGSDGVTRPLFLQTGQTEKLAMQLFEIGQQGGDRSLKGEGVLM